MHWLKRITKTLLPLVALSLVLSLPALAASGDAMDNGKPAPMKKEETMKKKESKKKESMEKQEYKKKEAKEKKEHKKKENKKDSMKKEDSMKP